MSVSLIGPNENQSELYRPVVSSPARQLTSLQRGLRGFYQRVPGLRRIVGARSLGQSSVVVINRDAGRSTCGGE